MTDGALQKLTTAAQQIAAAAVDRQKQSGSAVLGTHHWLAVILERYAPMARSVSPGLDPAAVLQKVNSGLKGNETGTPAELEAVCSLAYEKAQKRARLQAAERDLIAVVLELAGYPVQEGGQSVTLLHADPAGDSAPAGTGTPTLDKFGRDLTYAARQGKLTSVVGRDDEISQMIEILCRRTKRNPVLVGPAGVGKTAVVEALAARIVAGDVPALLKDVRLISLQPSTLVAGASVSGELEKRMQSLLREAGQPGVILFIDEIHTVIGAGGMVGTTDIGSMLKPALARGEIACIAATTSDEYRRFIEGDSALERRFNPVRINEPSAEETLLIARSLRDEMTRANGIQMPDDVLEWLIQFADHYMRNRHFPDKAVDLMEQCYANAITHARAAIDLPAAQTIAQRMVGMPLALEDRLLQLQQALKDQGLLNPGESQALSQRLEVTMRGLDMRSSRPNAVLLLTSDARQNSEALAECIAASVYGSADRVISIDFSRFLQPEDINLLVGAPPGYVGYTDALPLHRLAQTPWCVLRFENIGSCHPYIRQVVTQAFKDGWLMDGRGRPMYLSDTIILLTADITIEVHHGLGFFTETPEVKLQDVEAAIQSEVGEELASQIDLVLFGRREIENVSEDWLKGALLEDINKLYIKQGVELVWDKSVTDWLVGALSQGFSDSDWEHWVDHALTPVVIPHIPRSTTSSKIKVAVKLVDGTIAAEKV